MRFYKPNKGASLPTLTVPAGPADIVLDKEAINSSGTKLVGKLDINKVYTKNGAAEIPLTYYDELDVPNPSRLLVAVGTLGNATASDIVKGKIAFTDAGLIEGTLEATGGEPSYTLQIKTENPTADAEYIMYYAPGSSEKTRLTLTTTFQSFTSGDFICLNKTGDNISTGIDFLASDDAPLVSVSVALNTKYVINPTSRGWNIINIGLIKRDFPSVAKIIVSYRD